MTPTEIKDLVLELCDKTEVEPLMNGYYTVTESEMKRIVDAVFEKGYDVGFLLGVEKGPRKALNTPTSDEQGEGNTSYV